MAGRTGHVVVLRQQWVEEEQLAQRGLLRRRWVVGRLVAGRPGALQAGVGRLDAAGTGAVVGHVNGRIRWLRHDGCNNQQQYKDNNVDQGNDANDLQDSGHNTLLAITAGDKAFIR